MAVDHAADVDAINRIAAVPAILDVVCRTTGMGFAAVARVTEDRWIACSVRDMIAFGLAAGGELKIETTICNEIRHTHEMVAIDHVSVHPTFASHPTPALYGFESYISCPILLADGSFFGTLCAIDPRPMAVERSDIVAMFRLFAELIAFHLDAQQRLALVEARLDDAQETAQLREQFIAVLGHDLRNPLSAIEAGTSLLARTPLDARALTVLGMMRKSVDRMGGLIDNVLDLARGRLGGGLTLTRGLHPIGPILVQVAAELGASAPDRAITEQLDYAGPLDCDPVRIAQLVSNLIGNALTHGAADGPVRVIATVADGRFELAVCNRGDPIPAAALARLFQPFKRGAVRANQAGLGLGLYIAAEIARAHGGTLDAISDAGETRFTFRMPV